MVTRGVRRGLGAIRGGWYGSLDGFYRRLDRGYVRRSSNLLSIPGSRHRTGGKHAYAEWAHVIGVFQTLLYQHLDRPTGNAILDVGCGTGLLAIASEPFVGDGGRYVGLDVSRDDVEFCRRHYSSQQHSFIHVDARNRVYAPDQRTDRRPWPLEESSFGLVTALSVWTHLDEGDARHYLAEVERVLEPGGRAIITFFVLDDAYDRSLPTRTDELGRHHRTNQLDWVFDVPLEGSTSWFSPSWAAVAEEAVGITAAGLSELVAGAGLERIVHYPGNWKEIPGVFFQDVVVLGKRH